MRRGRFAFAQKHFDKKHLGFEFLLFF